MGKNSPHSRWSGFYNLSLEERLKRLQNSGLLTSDELAALSGASGLSADQADCMIENVVGTYSLPVGIALNFVVNGSEVLVPMVIEEPSVVAGASFMAKLVRSGGGFRAQADEPHMIGQIQILEIQDLESAKARILEKKNHLLDLASQIDPVLLQLGGGPRDIEVRIIEESELGAFLVLHLIYDVRDAMGANAVNTAVEAITPEVEKITGGRAHLRILSNLADRRLARAHCRIPIEQLTFDRFSGERVRDGIVEAWAFADADPYRAATHNKGIMNGIDAVVIATGNDWRAIEAGAHAYAARDGRYTSLSRWWVGETGDLMGTLELPMAAGIVGGATRVHPGAQAAIKLMGVKSAKQLAEILVSVGLAQNLAALRALATEGIQRGHMSLHARQVAMTAGAKGEALEYLVENMISDGVVRIDNAKRLLNEWKNR